MANISRENATLFNNVSQFVPSNASGKGQWLYLDDQYWLAVIASTSIGAAGVIGSIGNLMVIICLCLVKNLRNVGNLFVGNLAAADLLVTAFINPMNIVGLVAARQYLISNPTLCEWIASFCAPACMTSLWSMCAISLNRYVLICKPHLYDTIFTPTRAVLMCVAIWVFAHAVHLPNHIGWGHNKFIPEYYICTADFELHSYGIFYVQMGVTLPLIGVLFGYTQIFRKVRGVKQQLRNHRNRIQQQQIIKDGETGNSGPAKTSTSKVSTSDIKLVKTLFAAFFVFFICWLPFTLLAVGHQPRWVPGWCYVVSILMAHTNPAVNPILYGATNEKFRTGYRVLLGCGRQVKPGMSDPSTHRGTTRTERRRSSATLRHAVVNNDRF